MQDAHRPLVWAQDLSALPQRSQLALWLEVLAALFSGLPLAVQIVVPVRHTYAITCCRFAAGAVVGGSVLCALHATRPAPA